MKQTLFSALFAALFAGAAAAQPSITTSSLIKFEEGNNTWKGTVGALASVIGTGGTVTNFSSGNLSPLFTTSVSNPTTTPSQTFSLSNAAANTWFGNNTGSAAAPAFNAAGTLSKTDDTNVTLTLGGTPSNSVLQSVSLTLGWTGILAPSRGGTNNGFTAFTGPASTTKTFTLPNASATVLTDNAAVTAAQGGTGQTTYTVGDLLYASAATTLSKLTGVATGNALISGGVATAPSWGKIGLTTHVDGTLAISNGGTGLTAVGGDVTLFGSNGTANIYYTPAFTHNDAAFGFSRASTTLNVNVPNATASLGGIVSTATQTFAGAKTFTGAATVQGLLTGSAGVDGTATSGVGSLNAHGVTDGDFVVITANTTLDHTHHYVAVGTLTADITVSLPACNSTRDGWEYYFTKTGSDAFAFILDPNSTETFFDSATTKSVYSQGSTAYCKCRSSNTTWFYSSGK